jgi:hypothetical protein
MSRLFGVLTLDGVIPLTAHDFRSLALDLPEAVEDAHMGHPDFRVRGKIFATLPKPADDLGMVKLRPNEQTAFVQAEPKVFQPVKGGWGRRGATYVYLRAATVLSVRQALAAAWRNAAPKRLSSEANVD